MGERFMTSTLNKACPLRLVLLYCSLSCNLGYAKVNFVRGQARDMGAAMAMHAALMIAAFLGLMPLGMFIARYLKRTFVHWFRMHLVLIVTALAMALISIILIVDAVSLSSLARGYHQIFALLAIVVTVLVQPLLGIMSDYKWRQAMRRVQEVYLISIFMDRPLLRLSLSCGTV